MIPKQAVRVFITDTEGKLLLHFKREVKHGETLYYFIPFGGKVESNEAPEAAALREIQEETGLILQPEHLKYLLTWTNDQGVEVLHYKYTQPVSWSDFTCGENYGVAMVPYAELPSIPLAASLQWFYQQYPQLP